MLKNVEQAVKAGDYAVVVEDMAQQYADLIRRFSNRNSKRN